MERGTIPSDNRFVETALCASRSPFTRSRRRSTPPLWDAEGNFIRAEVHVTFAADIAANGITLHESDHWTDFFFADGTHRKVGTLAHISSPGAW